MRIFKQLTLNEVTLQSSDFKRELSMQSYLVDNPDILRLNDTNFSTPSIVGEEMNTHSEKFDSIAGGRIDVLVEFEKNLAGIVELKKGKLEGAHVDQLEKYLENRRIELETTFRNFDHDSKERADHSADIKWIGVLVGTSIDDQLRAEIENGRVTSQGIPLAAIVLNRFRQGAEALFVISETYFKEPSGKDYTKYIFRGKTYGKGPLVLEVVQTFVQENPLVTYRGLINAFPLELQGTGKIFFAPLDKAIEMSEIRKRYFLNPGQELLVDGNKYAVSNQWGTGNIEKFVAHMNAQTDFKIELA